MEHVYYDRNDGLAHCKVCDGGEGSLPTDCPGARMDGTTQEAVYSGDLDFKDGVWQYIGDHHA